MSRDVTPTDSTPDVATEGAVSADRAKTFADAVVAIAMTLLILPLLTSIQDLPNSSGQIAAWFAENRQPLISFGLSFVIIGMFWINHHRLFSRVERVTPGLLWLLLAWLLTIVWLPVATALSGQIDARDPFAVVVYIGSMILTSVVALLNRLFLRRHKYLHTIGPTMFAHGLAADLAMIILFAASLAVAIALPDVGYFALLLMSLTGVLQKPLAKLLEPRRRLG